MRRPPLARDHADPGAVSEHNVVIVHAAGTAGKLAEDPGSMFVDLVNSERTPPCHHSPIDVTGRPGDMVCGVRPVRRNRISRTRSPTFKGLSLMRSLDQGRGFVLQSLGASTR
jgi:hypothetical protein